MDLRKTATFALALTFPVLMGSLPTQDWVDPFEKPVRLQDENGVINVDVGHAAPFVADIDKDGKPDLLVGQFGKGRLRIYKNVGKPDKPSFAGFEWMMAEKEIASVPIG